MSSESIRSSNVTLDSFIDVKPTLLLSLGIICLSFLMRGPVTMVGPIANNITEDYGLTSAMYGYLAALPILAFGFFSFGSARSAKRLGLGGALIAAAACVAVGCSLRVFENTTTLYVGTLLVGAGIAQLNVLMPVGIRAAWSDRVGTYMGLYTMTIGLSAGVGSLTSVPLADYTQSEVGPFGIWALLGWAAVALSIPGLKSLKSEVKRSNLGALFRSKVAWALTTVMGLQSLMIYTVAAWAPSYWISQGISKESAGAWLFLFMMSGLPTSLFCAQYMKWCRKDEVAMLGLTALYIIGLWAWLQASPTGIFIGCVSAGVAQGAMLPVALLLMAQKSSGAHEMLAISAMSQGIGYLVAGLGPIVFGLIHAYTGGWLLSFGFLFVILVLWAVGGVFSARYANLQGHRRHV